MKRIRAQLVLALLIALPAIAADNPALGELTLPEISALRHFSGWSSGIPNERQLRYFRCGVRMLKGTNHSTALDQLTLNMADDIHCRGDSAILDAEVQFRVNIQRAMELAITEQRPFVYMGKRTKEEPEVVALGPDKAHIKCSGVMLSKRVILTAAHCTCKPFGPIKVLFYDAEVTAASNFVKIDDVPHRLGGTPCPDNIDGAFHGSDVAVLVAESDVPVSAFARPANAAESQAAHAVSVFGYGRTTRTDVGGNRTFATGILIASLGCNESLPPNPDHPGNNAGERYDCVPGAEFVAGDPWANAPDSCFGDSGGPAFIRLAKGPNNYAVVLGVVSRSIRGGNCGDGGVYSLLTPQTVRWIDDFVHPSQDTPGVGQSSAKWKKGEDDKS